MRGPNFPNKNYWADELPDAAAKQKSFPAEAKLDSLADSAKGHQDAAFNAIMSFYWGVPHLIWKTNNQAGGRPAYQFETLSRDELLAGAVAYNGGGDPNYEKKIDDALSDQGGVSRFSKDLRENDFAQVGVSALAEALSQVQNQVGNGKLFPHGISQVSFSLTLPGGTGFSMTVQGLQS